MDNNGAQTNNQGRKSTIYSLFCPPTARRQRCSYKRKTLFFIGGEGGGEGILSIQSGTYWLVVFEGIISGEGGFVRRSHKRFIDGDIEKSTEWNGFLRNEEQGQLSDAVRQQLGAIILWATQISIFCSTKGNKDQTNRTTNLRFFLSTLRPRVGRRSLQGQCDR